jgi:hypothetical protein
VGVRWDRPKAGKKRLIGPQPRAGIRRLIWRQAAGALPIWSHDAWTRLSHSRRTVCRLCPLLLWLSGSPSMEHALVSSNGRVSAYGDGRRNRGPERCGLRGAGNNVYGNCKDDAYGRAPKLDGRTPRAEGEERLHRCVMRDRSWSAPAICAHTVINGSAPRGWHARSQ